MVGRYFRLVDILRIIFVELDPESLKTMWDDDENTSRDMIKIIHLLYLLKARP
jgi:hypothetical protein